MRYREPQNHSVRLIEKPSGFSFIEIMVVIIILGLLAGLVGVSLFDSAAQARVDTTKTQIKGLETALDLYRLHNSRYPSTDQGLDALLKKPEVGVPPRNWNGPYLRSKNMPKDGWAADFKYVSDGKDYEIISLGADGAEGGTDNDADINSKDL
ncbi:MAG: type II secretion system major pseudopilin GspG [SAR324 cluster bacterium]|nr:type II secretion system major pseudopilin GspG [SAR324 cluster bacterium]MBF0352402.1 type II secretion system major pseudopilin GspG [SAR324 cluster bacterium]